MPFDALTYAWNHPDRLGPALSGRFAADALGPWARLDGSFDQLAEAVRPMTAAIVCGLRAEAMRVHVGVREVADAVNVPVIASGGAGTVDHIADGLTAGGAQAAIISSMLYSPRLDHNPSVRELKDALIARGVPMRPWVA